MAVAASPKLSPADEYQQLLTELEPARQEPRARLRFARLMFEFAQRCESDPQCKLSALEQATKLDPFQVRYRLALAHLEQDCGLIDAAIAEYKAALELWKDDYIRLRLAEAHLQKGESAKARDQLKPIVTEDLATKRRLAFCAVECDLREGKWKEAVEKLRAMNVTGDASGVALFLEKCTKLALEAPTPEVVQQALSLAKEKGGEPEPAFALLQRLADFTPASAKQPPAPFEALLHSYRLARTLPLRGTAQEVANLGEWKKLLARHSGRWSGLHAAYVAVLDEWARQAYQSKNLGLASVLWEEAQSLAPYDPAILHNLAIVHTRRKDDEAQQWYWDKATRSWVLFNEMSPDADGYKQALIQKHRAFVEGAFEKGKTLREWQELLELGVLWIREAVPYFCLSQLQYRNPYFRLGIGTADFAGDKEREQVISLGYQTMSRWLELAAQWEGLGKDSALAAWRRRRLETAYQDVKDRKNAFRFYDDERESFSHHREFMTQQYTMLVFRVMMEAAQNLDLQDTAKCESYAVLVNGLLSFPHELVKPGVLKAVEQLKPETDLRSLVQNQAAAPWASRAQALMEKGQAAAAIPLLDQMLKVLPDFAPGMFLLARCYAEAEDFDKAYRVLDAARKIIPPGDEAEEHIQKFAQQMDMARVNKRLENVQRLLKSGETARALADCSRALVEYPNHPYVLFVMAQAHVAQADVTEAAKSLSQAKKYCRDNEELLEAIKNNLEQLKDHAPEIVLSTAVPLMQSEKWSEALVILHKGDQLKPPDARVTFYQAICLARLGKEQEAEQLSKKALQQCTDEKLQSEIEGFMPQIQMARIGVHITKAREAMDKKRWQAALVPLDTAFQESPGSIIVLYYLAICHFQLENWDASVKFARLGLQHCKPDDKEQASIREQLDGLLAAVNRARQSKALGPIVEALNRENFADAIRKADQFLVSDPDNSEAHFLRGVARFRSLMNDINARRLTPHLSLFSDAEADAMKGLLSSDTNISSQALQLYESIQKVKEQLQGMGIW